ncbi:MAG: hypothetical protein HYY18_07125 [Planctomycetes bacterium]|nr:hypothetical protein [Planctomycetota bacterium]
MRSNRKCITALVALVAVAALAVPGCRRPKDGSSYYGNSSAPPIVEPSDTTIEETEDLPGLNFTVVGVDGGSGDDGNFESGDSVHVTFTVTRDDGSALSITEVDRFEVHISGPTFNYQRVIGKINVIPSIGEVPDEIEFNDDGSYTYEFPPLPDDYIDPPNYTGANPNGVLSGTPLVSGTYTLVLIGYKNYTVGGSRIYKDVANTTSDFLFGDVSVLEARDVVTQENCARCHDDLQYHTRGLPGGGRRKEVDACVTCHVAGAEDWNDPLVAGGTPGVSVEFKVMIHRLHNGSHLPSVVGVGTTGGVRDYTLTPVPYELVSDELEVLDFSAASFPWMPSGYYTYLYAPDGLTYTGTGGNGPMLRDVGYGALPFLSQKLQEDRIRTGMVACAACHGDPDDAGPLPAPAQGDLAYVQPSRNACGSCHDDVDWSASYTSNGLTMPAQPNDSECITCHVGTADTLDTITAHTHPWTDSALNPGVNLDVTGVAPGSGVGGNHIAGDTVAVTFSVTDAAGADVQIRTLTRFQMIVDGPMHNSQYILAGVDPRDGNWRKSAPFTGNGTISTPVVTAGALPFTLAVVCTVAGPPGTFDVLDNSGPGGTVVTLASGLVAPFGPVTYDGVTFSVTVGGTAYAAGDRWYFEIIPTAASYTMTVPMDIVYERVGVGGGGPWTVSNLPLYWGRQSVRERTAISVGTVTGAAVGALQQRYVIVDASTLAATGLGGLSIAVGDVVAIDTGLAGEEYVTIGRIQTTDDVTGADLGAADRMWFTLPMRYTHGAGAAVQEVTLSTRREGTQYTLGATPSLGVFTEVAGFGGGNPVLVSYRAAGRFGWRRAPLDPLQTYYQAPTFDSDDFDATWGEWKNLSLQSGTYKIGMWANRDFTVSPTRTIVPTESFTSGVGPNILTDNTTYRAISRAASMHFLFGTATTIEARASISSGENCNSCHGQLQFHGNGRTDLDTCLNCHAVPGTEDAGKYAYNSWYVGPTPGATVEFSSLIHKIHRGHELARKDTYRINGVVLGVPAIFDAEEIVFPSMGGGTSNCQKCHGEMVLPEEVQTWEVPDDKNHPMQLVPAREWRTVCGSCHDSGDASAHMNLNTDGTGEESCLACHGPGDTYGVRVVHKVR